jgi:DNA polymerase III subunit delta
MSKPNLVMMFGEDNLSLREELSRWQKGFAIKHGDMNMEELDGSSVSPTQVRAAISASPFLGEKRLVVVKDFQRHKKADAKRELKDVIELLPDFTILVLAENKVPDKRSSLYKYLVKNATLKPFNKPEGAALTNWILARMKKHGGTIDYSVAAGLAAIVGGDLWQLDNEIQKLSLYAAGQPVTKAMIDELVIGNLDQNIFEMTDRLARKDTAGTLKLFRELHEQGNEAPYLFAMVTRQFRLMLEMKAHHEQGTHPKSIATQMKVHPFVVTNTLKYCRNFSKDQLQSSLEKLLDVDRRLKTGRLHFRTREEDQYMLAIEKLLIQ